MKVNCEKIKIEAEITEWKSVLDSEQNIGMDGPLVDNEGYPRNDLDIPKIRMARQKIICLSNDHKEVMKKLASLLEDIHSQNPSENEPVRFCYILWYFKLKKFRVVTKKIRQIDLGQTFLSFSGFVRTHTKNLFLVKLPRHTFR